MQNAELVKDCQQLIGVKDYPASYRTVFGRITVKALYDHSATWLERIENSLP